MGDTDVQTLRLFLSMIELSNLTRAARRHNISPSAVTKRIRNLETFYKVTLFERQSRGVVPTAAGEELARQVRELFSRLDNMKGAMSEFAHGARGQIRVHASASILLEALVDSVASFTAEFPLVRVELTETMSWTIVRDVVDGRADVGLVAGSFDIPPDVTVLPYRQDRLMVLVPARHPLAGRSSIAFAEALDYDHVGIGVTSAISVQLGEEANRLRRIVRYSYRVATYDVARWMVARGCGIAILPSSLVVPYAEAIGLACIPLVDSWARREMRICLRDEAALTVAARLFVRHLQRDHREATRA